jgi:hypothetical protein
MLEVIEEPSYLQLTFELLLQLVNQLVSSRHLIQDSKLSQKQVQVPFSLAQEYLCPTTWLELCVEALQHCSLLPFQPQLVLERVFLLSSLVLPSPLGLTLVLVPLIEVLVVEG